MCLETQTLELFMKDICEDFQCQNFQRDHLVKAAFRQQMKPKFKVPKDYIFAERANNYTLFGYLQTIANTLNSI